MASKNVLPPPITPNVVITPTVACEVCGKVVNTNAAYSLVINYAIPGLGFAGMQCPAWQHWACTHEHAVIAVIACLFEHIEAQPGYAAHGKAYGGAFMATLKQSIENYVAVQGAGGI